MPKPKKDLSRPARADMSRLGRQAKTDKRIHADSKHAKAHGKKLVEEEGYLRLDKAHKDWYNRGEMGKQRGKPKYAPPKQKKAKKVWKHK